MSPAKSFLVYLSHECMNIAAVYMLLKRSICGSFMQAPKELSPQVYYLKYQSIYPRDFLDISEGDTNAGTVCSCLNGRPCHWLFSAGQIIKVFETGKTPVRVFWQNKRIGYMGKRVRRSIKWTKVMANRGTPFSHPSNITPMVHWCIGPLKAEYLCFWYSQSNT